METKEERRYCVDDIAKNTATDAADALGSYGSRLRIPPPFMTSNQTSIAAFAKDRPDFSSMIEVRMPPNAHTGLSHASRRPGIPADTQVQGLIWSGMVMGFALDCQRICQGNVNFCEIVACTRIDACKEWSDFAFAVTAGYCVNVYREGFICRTIILMISKTVKSEN
jgi:hypothetical protein